MAWVGLLSIVVVVGYVIILYGLVPKFSKTLLFGGVTVAVGVLAMVFALNVEMERRVDTLHSELLVEEGKELELEGLVQERVIEVSGVFDVEILSRNKSNGYYSVRAGKELYKVYYTGLGISKVEKNEKFVYQDKR